MTDLHTHILPGVDDGAQTLQDSIAILKYMKEKGVEYVYCTPHLMNDLEENIPEKLQKRFEQFRSECTVEIGLSLAGEYMLDENFPKQLKNGLLTYADNFVLIETSYIAPPADLIGMIFEIILAGYQPILAHPERYLYMQDEDYKMLKDKGCNLQLNLFSLCGFYGSQVVKNAKKLLKKGYYDFTGSDVHKLSTYRHGLEKCELTSYEIREISRLQTNNHTLRKNP
ncbi:MAG: hypothetical protein LIP01_01750 [Tannerellaceae bacterium]|nr:hypothetical protein [Tannerellaceae bacterium]